MYIVISNPKRRSVNSGFVQFMVALLDDGLENMPLTSRRHAVEARGLCSHHIGNAKFVPQGCTWRIRVHTREVCQKLHKHMAVMTQALFALIE